MTIRRNMDRLPRKILLHIARFLFIEDIIYLSMTCKRLRRILPLRLILGDNIKECGPKTWESWVPSTYFDTPTLSSPVTMATISMNWRDQGWGVQKGKIWLQLIRPRMNNNTLKVVYENKDVLGVVPHTEQFMVKILTREDPIINMARSGDRFRFMKNVGGGTWRCLMVRKFKFVLVSDIENIVIKN